MVLYLLLLFCEDLILVGLVSQLTKKTNQLKKLATESDGSANIVWLLGLEFDHFNRNGIEKFYRLLPMTVPSLFCENVVCCSLKRTEMLPSSPQKDNVFVL